MKKMTTMIALMLILSLKLLAPDLHQTVIVKEDPVKPFQKLIYAVGMTEGSCDTLAYNEKEDAVGFFQIRPVRLNEYNDRTGSSYTMNDMYNYQIAEKIFLYYASAIGPYNFEKIARSWNGSGPMTITYWKKVNKYINT